MSGLIAEQTLAPSSITFWGYRINPMTARDVTAAVATTIERRQRLIMANINFHGMALAFESRGMRWVLNHPKALVMIDSMPLLFMARLGGHRLSREQRTTSLEFYQEMFEMGVRRGWRFGFVGGTPEVLEEGLSVLRARHPGIQIDGRDGYFDMTRTDPDSDHEKIIAWLNEANHDVVIVGMGMPRQEDWIRRVFDRTPSRVFLPAGGYLDYQVGVQRRAPRWMGQIGLEWAYRLMHAPRRLGYRYLVEPFILWKRLLSGPVPHDED